jgi:hypothetical protein
MYGASAKRNEIDTRLNSSLQESGKGISKRERIYSPLGRWVQESYRESPWNSVTYLSEKVSDHKPQSSKNDMRILAEQVFHALN